MANGTNSATTSSSTWPGDSRRTAGATRSGISVGALLLSTIFVVLLVTDPAQLTAAYEWIRALPIVIEVLAWLVLLPWMLAYLAWQSSWDLWLRVVVLVVLLGGFASNFWRSSNE